MPRARRQTRNPARSAAGIRDSVEVCRASGFFDGDAKGGEATRGWAMLFVAGLPAEEQEGSPSSGDATASGPRWGLKGETAKQGALTGQERGRGAVGGARSLSSRMHAGSFCTFRERSSVKKTSMGDVSSD